MSTRGFFTDATLPTSVQGSLFMVVGVSGITELGQRLLSITGPNSDERDNIYFRVLSELGVELAIKLKEATPRGATNNLANSTSFHVRVLQDPESRDTIYQLVMTQDADSNQFVYRPIVVSGRQPGRMPPALALQGWVELKWGLTGQEAAKGAFRLARHIAAFGTQPNDYIQKVIVASAPEIQSASNNLGQQLSIHISDF